MSIHVHPSDTKRAEKTLKFVRDQCRRWANRQTIIGGDLNCVMTATSIDVCPAGRVDKSTNRSMVEDMVAELRLIDPVNLMEVDKREHVKYMTRWDPRDLSRGRRIDRFYVADGIAREKLEIWTEPYPSMSDHKMVCLYVNSSGESGVKNAPQRIPRRALESEEIKEMIRDEFRSRFLEGMRAIRSTMEDF